MSYSFDQPFNIEDENCKRIFMMDNHLSPYSPAYIVDNGVPIMMSDLLHEAMANCPHNQAGHGHDWSPNEVDSAPKGWNG